MCILFICRRCSNGLHHPPSSVFSPLMSLFVASNTYQLAQWCIAPNKYTHRVACFHNCFFILPVLGTIFVILESN